MHRCNSCPVTKSDLVVTLGEDAFRDCYISISVSLGGSAADFMDIEEVAENMVEILGVQADYCLAARLAVLLGWYDTAVKIYERGNYKESADLLRDWMCNNCIEWTWDGPGHDDNPIDRFWLIQGWLYGKPDSYGENLDGEPDWDEVKGLYEGPVLQMMSCDACYNGLNCDGTDCDPAIVPELLS